MLEGERNKTESIRLIANESIRFAGASLAAHRDAHVESINEHLHQRGDVVLKDTLRALVRAIHCFKPASWDKA